MTTTGIPRGHCKHGEFSLVDGCEKCIVELAEVNSPANIAKRIREADHDVGGGFSDADKIKIQVELNQSTAIVKVNPEQDSQVLYFLTESNKLRDYAESRVITKVEDLTPATNDLSLIAKIKKSMEEKKKEYLKPLQDYVKAVNETFKTLMAPIEDADRITRQKILVFKSEQERKAKEVEEINRLRMEAAKKEMELKGELTEPVSLVEAPPPPPAHVRTESGTLGTAKIWKFEVTDFTLLPNEYKLADEVKIGKVVRATKGSIAIPGVKIWPEDILKINAK